MKITKSKLEQLIKEEVNNHFDDTAHLDGPEYRINDVLVTAASKEIMKAAWEMLKNSGPLPRHFMEDIALEIEEPLMAALLPIARRIEHTKQNRSL